MILGALLFLAPYGGLFWAEKILPSGVASVLVATIPLWTVFLEAIVFKANRLNPVQFVAIALGFAGVVVVATGGDRSGGHFALLPCLALMGSSLSWSLGTVVSKRLILPDSKVMSSGAQMLAGGGLLLVFSAATQEFRPAPAADLPALLALIYLITAGSIAGFTAYTWLLGRMPATTVASYAYVNPVVALLLGHVFGDEEISAQTLWGSAVIVISVILLLRAQRMRSAPMSASVSVRT
jgi:drug/metabolite transporter (DMT)-like permease